MVIGFVVVLLTMGLASGLVSIPGPRLPSFGDVGVTITLPEEARIIDIEPISLDCRARVHAEVPIEGERRHTLGDFVYRVDRITMTAIGDVDTCVKGDAAQVRHNADGTTEVVIPGPSITFERPRVDANKTAGSVEVDKDFVGKLTDVFPWVSDNTNLTPTAYAYAQNVIGSSECMRTAYEVTEGILLDAYRQQAIDQGVDEDRLEVRIDGEPTFAEEVPVELEGVEFGQSGEIMCVASGEFD